MNNSPVLITGGAGFVGTNLAARFGENGRRVIVFDSLARPGVRDNLDWLQTRFGDLIQLAQHDVRDPRAVDHFVDRAGAVFHFAGQVAVTTSLQSPLEDFEINARGTLNVLEALRCKRDRSGAATPLVFTSTNKVYGDLEDLSMTENADRYTPSDAHIARNGIDETRALDFHSPYGCSKGAADQYVLDYARSFDLPMCVFRMSCIYGPHQKGTEDQGWVAHFLLQALRGEPITLYGDGKQVRDVLWVEDLVDAFQLALERIDELGGRAWNIGGGAQSAVSLLEVVREIERLHGEPLEISFGPWRAGDQKFYVSNTQAFERASGWRAQTGALQGIAKLYNWLQCDRARGEELEVLAR